jgi:hypothetical protein
VSVIASAFDRGVVFLGVKIYSPGSGLPRQPFLAQFAGIFVGAIISVLAFVVLVPKAQALGADQFPAHLPPRPGPLHASCRTASC